jgi:nicotinic acid phosphoribosyltransferase
MFRTLKRTLAGLAALAALALGGAAIAGAASSTTSTTTTAPPNTQANPGSSQAPRFNGPAPGSAAHEDAETAVTGDAAAKAQAAAVKTVGGGSAGAVTTDYTKSGYETTVTKANGEKVDVHLDSSFNAMQGPGGHGGPPPPATTG